MSVGFFRNKLKAEEMTLFNFTNGEKYIILDINFINNLKAELSAFQSNARLNDFQKWIVDELYRFDLPQADFNIQSILLVAVPHPLYAEVSFECEDKDYDCVSLVSSDFKSTEKIVDIEIKRNERRYLEAKNLPLKRLAVHCGLSLYGRNNITYIGDMGSCFSYIAYYTDLPPAEVEWKALQVADACEKCGACFRICPTKAIREDSFLIDNQRCLSYLNESGAPFPDWVPITAHHSLYDCIRCQIVCPMNKNHVKNLGKKIFLSKTEINILLKGVSPEQYPRELRDKAKYLGFDQWPAGIAKNIRTLISKGGSGNAVSGIIA